MNPEMNKMGEKIIEAAQNVELTLDEKNVMRGEILNFMANNPVRPFFADKKINKVKSPFYFFSIHTGYAVSLAVLMIVLLGGGTTSYIAQKSLPGDTLYPVKINVNETIESTLAVSAKDSALIDLSQATRRLSEAETLSDKGSLTATQNTEIQNNFSKKIASMNTSINLLEDKGEIDSANEVKGKFEAEVGTYEKRLAVSSTKSSTTRALFDTVKVAITNSRKTKEGSKNNSTVTLASAQRDSNARYKGEENKNTNSKSKNSKNTNPPQTFSLTTQEATAPATTTQKFTLSEVSKHNATTSCYMVIKGEVYDFTEWIAVHQKESAVIKLCGKDTTFTFWLRYIDNLFSDKELESLKIGVFIK